MGFWEIVKRHFNAILNAVICLQGVLLKKNKKIKK